MSKVLVMEFVQRFEAIGGLTADIAQELQIATTAFFGNVAR
jgi:hypothetical protein